MNSSRENRLTPELRARIDALHDEGRAIFQQFDREVRSQEFHPFKPASYDTILDELLIHRSDCRTFLEWGSATGVIAITADLLGFDAYGIEIDPQLVAIARELAARHGSNARFAAGSMLPSDYAWRSPSGDARLGTIEPGESGYPQLGHELADFDLVYGYPWSGEDPMMLDLMAKRSRVGARLLLNRGGVVQVYETGHGALHAWTSGQADRV